MPPVRGQGLERLLEGLRRHWPEYALKMEQRLTAMDQERLAFCQDIADLVRAIAQEDLPGFCADFRWLCQMLLQEEMAFRRSGRYRLSTFAEANAQVYARPEVMVPYLRGLLISQVAWPNHLAMLHYYHSRYLGRPGLAGAHLEIGPGHGILLVLAARHGGFRSVEGWDVSPSSVDLTRRTLEAAGVASGVTLRHLDAFGGRAADGPRFDSIVVSEVLEHLEHPGQALASLGELLTPQGLLFVNVPVNSPAPDHIHLLKTPQEAAELVEASGFKVLESAAFPANDYSLAKACRTASTISCALIASAA